MKPSLTINFGSQTDHWRWAGRILLVAGGLAAAVALFSYSQARIELEEAEQRLRRVRSAEVKEDARGLRTVQEAHRLETELEYAQQVITHLAFPWDALFGELERAVTKDVVLLGMEPDTERRLLAITAEARSIASMLMYLKRLKGGGAFSDVRLVSHQVQIQDPQRPVRFTIDAHWDEALLTAGRATKDGQ